VKDNKLDIKRLFEPRSVAVIGASSHKDKIGYKIVENILAGGYASKLYPINPRGGEVLGLRVYKSVDEVDGEIDVACLAIPAGLVFDAVERCAERGVKFIPIISSGFSEVGNIEGEKKIASYARQHGMRVLGPNIFGIYSAKVSLNATFGPRDIKRGNVAIITQSGALGIAMIGKTAAQDIGLSSIVSVGNKSDVDEADLLEYLIHDDDTKVVMIYVEGIKDGERLVGTLKQGTRKKPVVVIKSGRSERGAIAAASHTGSLAGADEVFDSIMGQCGVLRAESLREAFDWCKFLADTPLPSGQNTLIITNGGGIGVMATDACEKYGVKLYDDAHTLSEIFSTVTPDFGSTKNPIDLTGQAAPEDYRSALGAALKQGNINAVIALYCETALFDVEDLSSMIEENDVKYKSEKKPIAFSILGGERIEGCIDSLRKRRVAAFDDVYEAVSCLGATYAYYRHLGRQSDEVEEADIDVSSIEGLVENALKDGRSFLLAHEGQSVMKAAGLPVPKSYTARGLDEAVRRAQEIGHPVVMKIVSKDILHKSDVGGVALDLENTDEVIDAYQAIIRGCRMHRPDAIIEGVEVSEMVESGTEVIIGARRDRTFGPVVMFGLGGIYVEVMKDVSFRSFPLDRQEVMSMIKEIRTYPLLLGVRGEEQKDVDGIVDAIVRLGTVVRKCYGISDIEINPLVVYGRGKGVRAVDVRILVGK